MGNQQSQPEFVLRAPTEFSEKFVRHLQESTETDTSRYMDMENYIQKRVQDELKQLQLRQKKAIDAIQEEEWKSNAKTIKDSQGSLDSNLLSAEFRSFQEKLEKQSSINDKELKIKLKEVESIRSDLLKCMSEHPDKSLICHPLAEKFAILASKLHNPKVGSV
ncbi:MICOS complex subunit mic19 [Schizosaccharomyces pombe]|uniref:MICOS complex subunit mic19 n=1 Tax=Schizosaccharomyces pombe (strain 972 / ATCC 24843) TaxID=284812 RepID=MIC19_SCHPO|nr:uncharacterized protein SPBC25H2.09 [Schizosaccharomyces pombe]P87150.1 RecName: Full=MICOS complex subunit mic19 [Schizosaccharomyces pombe 972h-]CAB08785.1 DUF1690 family protein [Schizosaccharomyces pombe]|eukprot:NP_596357.1 uncharacterized protein SPBC25H2.09 [Schizosaccharomyces pombe]